VEKGDRGIDVKKAIVEPLSLCPTLSEDPHGPFPFFAAEDVRSKQLADLSCAGFDGSQSSRNAIPLNDQGFCVHP